MKKQFTLHALILFISAVFIQTLYAREFVHPGIEISMEDLEYMKAHKDIEPWKSSYELIFASPYSALDYQMAGPFDFVNREPNENFSEYEADSKAAFFQAILYNITGNQQYGENALEILDAWATTHKEWGGGTVHIQDFRIIEAAEILRHTYPGWTDEHSTNFENYARNVLLGVTHYPYTAKAANQGVLQLYLTVRVAIFLSDEEMFEIAIDALVNDPCAGIGNSLPNGQNGDTGRDQAHAWMVVNFLSQAAQAAYNQGVDLFSTLDDRLYNMGEYWFKYNLGYDVEWIPFGTCYGYYPTIGETARGELNTHPRLYETLHRAYVLRKGYDAPYLYEFRNSQSITENTFLYRREEDFSSVPDYCEFSTEPWVEHSSLNTDELAGVNLGSDKSGYSTFEDDVLTIYASSGDVYGGGSSDGGYYEYINVQGDATIIAKINSHVKGVSNSKVGVMFRESLSATSDMFAIHSTSDQMMATWRGYEGPAYTSERQYYPEVDAPVWVKLVINGNRISGYISEDKMAWAPMGGKHYDGTDDYYLGVFGASINTTTETIGTFSEIEVYNSVECADYSYESFKRIEAESFCMSEGVDVFTHDEQTYTAASQDAAWIRYPNFNFSTQLSESIDLSYASETLGEEFYLKLNDPVNGEIIATFVTDDTGGLTTFSTLNSSLSNTTDLLGMHDIYLVFNQSVNVDWFAFKNSCQQEPISDGLELIEAENYCAIEGGETIVDGEISYIGNTEAGDWLYYPNLDFSSEKPNSVFISAASATGGAVKFMLNDPINGTFLSKIEVPSTGSDANFAISSSSLASSVSFEGLYDVYITFESGCSIDYFYFDNNSCYSSIFYSNQLIEAEDYCEMSGITTTQLSESNSVITDINDGDFIRFPRIQLGAAGSNVFELTASSAGSGGVIEIRKNAIDGELLGSLDITNTGDWDTYETFELEFENHLTAYHDIYLVFSNSTSPDNLFRIDNFMFKHEMCPDMYYEPYEVIQAQDYCSMFGVEIYNDSYLGNIQSGDWVHFANVDFGDVSPLSVKLNLSGYSDENSVDVIIDNIGTGELIASKLIDEPTNGWTNWRDYPVALNQEVTGLHDVYIIFRNGGNNINYLQFSDEFIKEQTDPYERFEAEINDKESGTVPIVTTDVDGNEELSGLEDGNYIMFSALDIEEAGTIDVRLACDIDNAIIEVRVGAVNGPIISFIDIPNTGSLSNWETFNATIDQVSGTNDIYFVVRGEGSDIVRLNWLQFIKEDSPVYDVIDASNRIEVESYFRSFGTETRITTDIDGEEEVSFLQNNEWLLFKNVDLTGAATVDLRVASQSGGVLYLYSGAYNNSYLSIVSIPSTGSLLDWETISGNLLLEGEGVKDIYVILKGVEGNAINVNWLQFKSKPTSIDKEIPYSDINIYPNPVSDFLNIENAKGAKVEIYSTAGYLVLQDILSNYNETINLDELKHGSYIVKITKKDSVTTRKILKK